MEFDSTNNKGEYFINAEDTSEMVRRQWVLDVAFHYPHIDVTGIDISESIMESSARKRPFFLP